MGQITVFSGAERRRRWSDGERAQILTEAFSPGACVAGAERRHDVSTALIYTWRRQLREAQAEPVPGELPEPGFAQAVMITGAAGAGAPGVHPAMVVDLARGKRVSIFASASPAQVAAALKALR
jgi:transposase